jgi:hypothetical protein
VLFGLLSWSVAQNGAPTVTNTPSEPQNTVAAPAAVAPTTPAVVPFVPADSTPVAAPVTEAPTPVAPIAPVQTAPKIVENEPDAFSEDFDRLSRIPQKNYTSSTYKQRIKYDKGPSKEPTDEASHKKWKKLLFGSWQTAVKEHGDGFRDDKLRFRFNDTLYSTTFTWNDKERQSQTGEYSFEAEYQVLSDSTMRTREVFLGKNMVRWDFYAFKLIGDALHLHLYKLEFRDLEDNWLDAIQKFDEVPPEIYYQVEGTGMKKVGATPPPK